jgi:hypothetical protein
MVPHYKKRAVNGLVPGLGLYLGAWAILIVRGRHLHGVIPTVVIVAILMLFVSVPFYLWGCVSLAKAKGYSTAILWTCFLGWLFPAVVLLALADKNKHVRSRRHRREKQSPWSGLGHIFTATFGWLLVSVGAFMILGFLIFHQRHGPTNRPFWMDIYIVLGAGALPLFGGVQLLRSRYQSLSNIMRWFCAGGIVVFGFCSGVHLLFPTAAPGPLGVIAMGELCDSILAGIIWLAAWARCNAEKAAEEERSIHLQGTARTAAGQTHRLHRRPPTQQTLNANGPS